MPVLLPNGHQTFLDLNGDPLSGGFVYQYIVGTATPKDSWSDYERTAPNPFPIVLDAAGRCTIWGSSLYRQVVTDHNGGVQWDQTVGFGTMAEQDADNVNITGGTIASGLFPSAFPAGTQMVFMQPSPPPGWVQATSVHDRVIRLVADGSGTEAGGGWSITGLTSIVDVIPHVLTADELPPHTHVVNNIWTVNSPLVDIQLIAGAPNAAAAPVQTDGGQVGNQGHTHATATAIVADGTWRPGYINAIIGVKL